MKRFRRYSFRTKMNLGIGIIVLFIAVTLSLLVGRMAASALNQQTRLRGATLAGNVAILSQDPLLAQDLLRLKNLLDDLKPSDSDIEYAFIQDSQGQILAHTFHGGFPTDLLTVNESGQGDGPWVQLLDTGQDQVLDFATRVRLGADAIGTVRLGLSQTRTHAVVDRLLRTIALVSLAVLVLALSLSTVFAGRISLRLQRLTALAEQVLMGDLNVQTGPTEACNCWESLDCHITACPAYGDALRRCWTVAGTHCHVHDASRNIEGRESCPNCPVYQANAGDEIQSLSEAFDVMTLILKQRLTQLESTERTLVAQRGLLRTLLDSTPDLVCLLDPDLRYLAVNETFARFVGRTPADVPGRTDFDLFDAAEAERRTANNRRVLETGQREQTEDRISGPSGERFFLTARVPVRDRNDQVAGVVLSSRDVSDIKHYEAQLLQAQKMESLGKLAGGVAHEINTPLGIILGYAQLLAEDAPAGSQLGQDLAIIERQAKSCRKIVADLLGFSRQRAFEIADMDLNHSVLEVISLVRHSFALENVHIIDDLMEDMPYVPADREKMKQVWMNLLQNAKDAMPEGGIIQVFSSPCEFGDRLMVAVADTGAGIGPEDLKKVFDPFFTTKPVGQGTGLGLSLSFGIVDSHGGRIEAASPVPEPYAVPPEKCLELGLPAPGPGALFMVKLPLRLAARPAQAGEHPLEKTF